MALAVRDSEIASQMTAMMMMPVMRTVRVAVSLMKESTPVTMVSMPE